MPRNRTENGIQVVQKKDESRPHISSFMITINQPVRFTPANGGVNTTAARQMYDRLVGMCNFMLRKKSIVASMVFENRMNKKTGTILKRERDDHIGLITDISEDRSASIEWGSRDYRLHAHLQFDVTHRTFLKLDISYYKRVAAKFLEIKPESVYVHISAATRWAGYKDYVRKGVNDSTKDFFDATANAFSFQSAAETIGSMI